MMREWSDCWFHRTFLPNMGTQLVHHYAVNLVQTVSGLGNSYESPNGSALLLPQTLSRSIAMQYTHSLAPGIQVGHPLILPLMVLSPLWWTSWSLSQPGVYRNYSPPPPVPNRSLNWSQGASSSSGVHIPCTTDLVEKVGWKIWLCGR